VCFIQTCIHTLDLTVFLCSPEYSYDIWQRIITLLGMSNVNNHYVTLTSIYLAEMSLAIKPLWTSRPMLWY